MNAPEQHLLSILRPGDMVRFVLDTTPSRKLDFFIEGAPASDDLGMMAERLTLALRELREAGFKFGAEAPGRSTARRSTVRKASARSMVEIRPRPLDLGGLSAGAAGFARESNPAEKALVIPAFHAFLEVQIFRTLANIVLESSGIHRFEIEFIRHDLPSALVKPLEKALALHTMSDVHGQDYISPQRAFLTLWLLHRSGYRVRARAWVNNPTPAAALEMIGRDIFACECHVVSAAPPDLKSGECDLSELYPRGWRILPIFPRPEFSEKMNASRLHNPELPDLPLAGFHIGNADGEKVRLPEESRDRHVYIVGGTGTGKSELLLRMIRENINAGEAVIVLDPHGDLFESALACVPKHRQKDLLLIDPVHPDRRPALNILDIHDGRLRKRHAELLIGELLQCFSELWNNPEAFGPMFETYFRHAIQLLTLREGAPKNVGDFNLVFADHGFRQQLLAECGDESTRIFWQKVAEKAGGEHSLANMTPYITCKMAPLTSGAFLSELLRQPRDNVRLAARINETPIILVNLNKGVLGVRESRVLGVILLAQIMSAGLGRSLLPTGERKPVNVYVDEFQNFVSDTMASMLAEARKFGLRFVLANQTLGQLNVGHGQQDLRETVLGNVGNMILFRLGVPDATRLGLFTEPFTPQEMQMLPNFHALVRLLTTEGPVRPVIMRTMKA
jgi:hypothetical protein